MMSIPPDKQAHFYWGATLGLGALWLGLLGLIPVITCAIAKEAWDRRHPPHTPELMDFVATVIGGCFTVLLVYLRSKTGPL